MAIRKQAYAKRRRERGKANNQDSGCTSAAKLGLAIGKHPRRAVHEAKLADDPEAEAAAHRRVDEVKQALGERGPAWWDDGSPDLNRRMVKNSPYADWYAGLARSSHGEQ